MTDGAVSDALELSGSLDVRRTAELRAQVYGLLGHAAPATSIVDISRVESIDMTTLKMLAVANRAAERAGAPGGAARRARPAYAACCTSSHLRSMIPLEPHAGRRAA